MFNTTTILLQMNQATHFLDGSHIYGSNGRDAAALREATGGLLKTSIFDDEEHMPLTSNPAERCLGSSDDTCFIAGKLLKDSVLSCTLRCLT